MSKPVNIGGLENLNKFVKGGVKAQAAVDKVVEEATKDGERVKRRYRSQTDKEAYIKRHYTKPDHLQRMVDLYGASGTARRLGESYSQPTISAGIRNKQVLQKYEDAATLYWMRFMKDKEGVKATLTSRSEQLERHDPESALIETQKSVAGVKWNNDAKQDAAKNVEAKIKAAFSPKPVTIESILGVKFVGTKDVLDTLIATLGEIEGVEVTIIN